MIGEESDHKDHRRKTGAHAETVTANMLVLACVCASDNVSVWHAGISCVV